MLSKSVAKRLVEIEKRVTELDELLKRVELEKEALARFKLKIGDNPSVKQFEQLRVLTNITLGREARVQQELQSLALEKTMLTQTTPITYERIVIGAGVAGTMLYGELPTELREKKNKNGTPAVIVLSDPLSWDQWRKDGHTLMGQPAKVQTPQIYSTRSEDFARDEVTKRNPYQYTMANDFYHATVCTQRDLGMTILNATAIAIETKATYNGTIAWEDDGFPHRIAVKILDLQFYLYTAHIDLCTGPGPTRKLTATQVDSVLSKQLLSTGKMIYGQDHGDARLKGNVVFYGGGARNAAMVLDIINGCQPDVTSFVWVARDGQNFDTNNMFNRQFSDLDDNPKAKMALGDLTKVELDDTGSLSLTFGKPVKQRKTKVLPEVTTLVCDQLVVAIGQEPHSLTSSLKGFVPCQLERGLSDLTETEVLPLGTRSSDGTILCWGAAGIIGTGLDDSRSFIDVGLKHAQSLPRESRANVGIFRSSIMIEKMVELLRAFYPEKFISTDKSFHRYDLPDINRASRSELYEIIRETMKATLSAEACLILTDKILEIRSQLPTGLEDIDVLAKEVPAPILKALKKAYVPFHIEEIVEPKVKVELPQLASVQMPTPVDRPEVISVEVPPIRRSPESIQPPVGVSVQKQPISINEEDGVSSPLIAENPTKKPKSVKVKIVDSSDRFFSTSVPTPKSTRGEFNALVEELRDEEDDNIQLPIIPVGSGKKPQILDEMDGSTANLTELSVYS